MIDQASTLTAPINQTTVAEQDIGVLALTANTASAAQDLLSTVGGAGYWWVTFICDQDFYVTFGDAAGTVRTPVIADAGWLGAGAANGRCWGPLPAKVEWHRLVGPESRWVKLISTSNATVRAYLSSRGPQGQLPAP